MFQRYSEPDSMTAKLYLNNKYHKRQLARFNNNNINNNNINTNTKINFIKMANTNMNVSENTK